MTKATLYLADGRIDELLPANGKSFTLEEMQEFVAGPGEKRGTIVQVVFPSGKVMTANDNGKLMGLQVNEKASAIWREEFPIEKYPHNNDGTLVGNILICGKRQAGR